MNSNGEKLHVVALLRLSFSNIKQWKGRYLSIAFFALLTMVLLTLYRGSMLIAQQERGAAVADLETPHFSYMVSLKPDDKLLDFTDYSTLMRSYMVNYRDYANRMTQEAAALVGLHSSVGYVELLGLQPGSAFYNSPIRGRTPLRTGEIMLPSGRTSEMQLGDTMVAYAFIGYQKREQNFTLVGIYEGSGLTAFPIITLEDALALMEKPYANRLLLGEGDDPRLIEPMARYLSVRYPQQAAISTYWPSQLSATRHDQSYSLLMLILLFAVISILTVGLMTFLERRPEYAALKAVGLTNRQILAQLGLEYGLATFSGIAAGGILLMIMLPTFGWLGELSTAQIVNLGMQNVGLSMLVAFVALIFPARTAQIATVNQLLFARKIPLLKRRIHDLENPRPEEERRQLSENVRFLRLPQTDGRWDCLLFKQEGSIVRQGETVAVMESWGGFVFQEWCSPCDGIVRELCVNGLVTIQRDAEDVPPAELSF